MAKTRRVDLEPGLSPMMLGLLVRCEALLCYQMLSPTLLQSVLVIPASSYRSTSSPGRDTRHCNVWSLRRAVDHHSLPPTMLQSVPVIQVCTGSWLLVSWKRCEALLCYQMLSHTMLQPVPVILASTSRRTSSPGRNTRHYKVWSLGRAMVYCIARVYHLQCCNQYP